MENNNDKLLGSFLCLNYLVRLAYFFTRSITYCYTTIQRPYRRRGSAGHHQGFIKFEFRSSRCGHQVVMGLAGRQERWIWPSSRLQGAPKHYYSFLACHGNHSPATNHLFLPDDSEFKSCYWISFSLRCQDTWETWPLGAYLCFRYRHRDINIGNVVIRYDSNLWNLEKRGPECESRGYHKGAPGSKDWFLC